MACSRCNGCIKSCDLSGVWLNTTTNKMELSAVPEDCYAGYVVDDSDLEYSDNYDSGSSDDQENYKNEQLSSEDEFEKSLVSEVLSTLRKVTPSPPGKTNKEEGRVPVLPKDQAGTSDQYYDEVYFDSSGSSDEEEDVRVGRNDPSGERGDKKKKHPRKVKKLTNDELFYDPEMDKEDERWVRRKCMSYYNVKVSQELEGGKRKENRMKEATVPKSDAILNCPACMTTLCLDCQRHDIYVNQYRAMFVSNCRVIKDEKLTYTAKPDKKSRKRKGRSKKSEDVMNEAPCESSNQFHPVKCSECNTDVAVIDADEVFHFFNVLASAS